MWARGTKRHAGLLRINAWLASLLECNKELYNYSAAEAYQTQCFSSRVAHVSFVVPLTVPIWGHARGLDFVTLLHIVWDRSSVIGSHVSPKVEKMVTIWDEESLANNCIHTLNCLTGFFTWARRPDIIEVSMTVTWSQTSKTTGRPLQALSWVGLSARVGRVKAHVDILLSIISRPALWVVFSRLGCLEPNFRGTTKAYHFASNTRPGILIQIVSTWGAFY